MSIKLGFFASSISGNTTNPVATSFFNRVTAAGGTLTNTEKNAVNTLVNSLQTAGIYTKFKIIYPYVGASAAACSINLISSNFTGSFFGGWSYSSNGILPNATNTYMKTNFIVSQQLTASNWHESLYCRSNTIVGIDCGTGDVAGQPATLMEIRRNGNSGFVCGTYGNYGGMLNIPLADSRGYFIGSIISDTNRFYNKNNTTLASNTANITTVLPIGEMIIGAYNSNNIQPSFFSDKQYAFFTMGDGLTNSECNTLYTIVQTFQTTLSRQV